MKANDPVALVISSGPPPVAVPNVVGQDQQAAVDTLAGVGLKADTSQQQFNDQAPEGSVISQDPPEGNQLGKGQAVKLVISKGPELIPVPNVFGQQYDQAKATLQQAGFQVQQEKFLGGAFGTVRFQRPRAGASAPKGSTVILTVV